MPLEFPKHDDVVFLKAPLELVLCQLRFSRVYALLDEAGASGFQEAIRRFYPFAATELEAAVTIARNRTEFKQSAPVWRFRDRESDWMWQVSLGVDFVSLDTPEYPYFDEFIQRLDFVLDAIERTVKPGRAQRIGLRKINLITHPSVSEYRDWRGLLGSGLLGLSEFENMPGILTRSQAEFTLDDGESGNLTIRHQIDEKNMAAYRIDMDYWTDSRRYEIRGGSDMTNLLRSYSESMTAMFHWILEPKMYDYLEPQPRDGVIAP